MLYLALLRKSCFFRKCNNLFATVDALDFSKISIPMRKAWTCTGDSQRELVENMFQANLVKSPLVKEIMRSVDRAHYIPESSKSSFDFNPYQDSPIPIGSGQTISAPHMHAYALEEILGGLLQLIATDKISLDETSRSISILDVGCGSGYLTGCLGRMIEKKENGLSLLGPIGKVYGIDFLSTLVELSKSNLSVKDSDLLESETILLSVGDGWKGLPSKAPFHAIHVGAAADEFPTNLMMQLVVGGIMICPMGPNGGSQGLFRIRRIKNKHSNFHQSDFEITKLLDVRYVPLVH